MEHEGTKPLVTVIIPVYNAEKTICETLDSVFAQTYSELQVLVVDDASTDSTQEKLVTYDDPRLEVIRHEKNKHVVESRNTALQFVKGDYVAFLDSDDIWVETKIEKQISFLENNPEYAACFTWGEIIDENSRPHSLINEEICVLHKCFHEGNRSHKEWFMRMLREANCLLCSSSLVRADILQKVGMQNSSLLQLQDFEYWIRILSYGSLYVLEEELTKYRRIQDGTAVSSWTDEANARLMNESHYVLTHFFDLISDDLFLRLFREEFRCQDSCTEVELMCEKAFLLKHAYCGNGPFMDKIQQILSNAAGIRVLSEKFNYTPKDFYRENATFRYADDVRYLQKEQECWQLQSRLCEMEMQFSALQASRSWRITAPLRKIMEILRGSSENNK